MRHLMILLAMVLAAAAAVTSVSAIQDTGDEKKQEKPVESKPAEMAYVLLNTSMGDIIVELNAEKAPTSVANFLRYADNEAYNGTIFHRVMSNFMIQGGGFDVDMRKRPTNAAIKNEWKNGLKNTTGTVAMARLGGNPDSATNQFFINVKDNPNLDRPQADGAGYAVFGKVHVGMKVVEAIRLAATTTKGRYKNVPIEPIIIKVARRITKEEADTAKAQQTG